MEVYFPASCRILTAGHIKCLKWLVKRKHKVILGLLSGRALRGYKREIVPFKDRLEIMKVIAKGIGDITVVRQDSLDPTENIIKYEPWGMASGDGWERCELEAIKRFHLKKVNIGFPKKYSSTAILSKFCKPKTVVI